MTQIKAAPAVPELSPNWGDTDGLPVVLADAIHWRTLPGICYITLGQMDLPTTDQPVTGPHVDVRPLIRVAVTPDILEMWHMQLTSALAQYKKHAGAKNP